MKNLKSLRVLVLLSLALALVAGCAPTAAPVEEPAEEAVEEAAPAEEVEVEVVEEEKEPVTLTIWSEYTAPPKSDIVDYWVETFEAKYPYITIDHRSVSNEVGEETIRVALLGDNPPDIFLPQSRGEIVEYTEADLLVDLTDFYNERADRFIPAFQRLSDFQSVVDGKRMAIPYTILHINMIWYNEDLLLENGIDATAIKTMEDLMAACETLKTNGEVCFQLGGGSTWPVGHWAEFFIQENLPEEEWLKLATGEKSWTDPDVVEAMSWLEKMYKAGYFQAGVAADTRDVSRANYFQGDGAFFAAGSWHLYQKGGELAPPDWTFKFIGFPPAAGSEVDTPILSTNNVLFAVTKQTENEEAALLFLDHITGLDVAQKHVELAQEFLVIDGAVTEENAGPEMVEIDEWAASGTGFNFLENYFTRPVVEEGMWAGTLGVLTGQATTEDWAQLIADLQESSGNLDLSFE